MKIEKIRLEKFSVFKDAEFAFSPGINVLIGANGTGKSHLLKSLYCLLKTAERPDFERERAQWELRPREDLLREKLSNVFRPVGAGGVGRLVNRRVGRATARLTMTTDAGVAKAELSTLGKVSCGAYDVNPSGRSIFIPSREVLSVCSSLRSAYESVNLSFDETYYDLTRELLRPTLRGRRGEAAERMVAPLQQVIGGSVYEENGIFYVSTGDGEIEAHLLAEGWRKIASVCRLILNGSLFKNSVLFWDEPEANLNPRLTKPVCELLRRLAAGGVQVFLSTHDYLLSSELSLAMEYRKQQARELDCEIRFFGLSRSADGGVVPQPGTTLADLTDNPILAEFADHYDRENALLDKAVAATRKITAAA